MSEQNRSSRLLSHRSPWRSFPAASGTNRDRRIESPPRRGRPGGQYLLPDDESIRCHCSETEDEAGSEIMPSSLPSLSSDNASASSLTSSLSLDTRWASGLASHILEDDGTGALVVPPRSVQQHHHRHHHHHLHSPPIPPPSPPPRQHTYICLFYILDCHDTFDDADLWRTHVLSHFRTHDPPQTARCLLCPSESFNDTPDRKAWDLLLDHVDVAHYQQGQTLAGSRPDFDLMRYLFRLRIISVEQFKAMQLPPPPSSPAYHRSQEPVRRNIGSSDEPYCAPYSRRREERMRGQRRGVSVA
ncbi:hypothetical protein FE257_009941 [Aspergillus nanangensis]|uniref:Uncharacterized protein n=1 Tax=Aspergillus nanangensis TaxID=2582783 RepID=A0AAD4GYC7_ASPNN|nr:hypothetical protein FE257_009941 [Aspergillus nanangensis]